MGETEISREEEGEMTKQQIVNELRRKLEEAISRLASCKNEKMKQYYEGKVDGISLALQLVED